MEESDFSIWRIECFLFYVGDTDWVRKSVDRMVEDFFLFFRVLNSGWTLSVRWFCKVLHVNSFHAFVAVKFRGNYISLVLLLLCEESGRCCALCVCVVVVRNSECLWYDVTLIDKPILMEIVGQSSFGNLFL